VYHIRVKCMCLSADRGNSVLWITVSVTVIQYLGLDHYPDPSKEDAKKTRESVPLVLGSMSPVRSISRL